MRRGLEMPLWMQTCLLFGTGPCTSNHTEGYHRSLSSVFDTRRRVPLCISLGGMQKLCHEIRQRVKQLEQGAPANPCRPAHAKNDRNLQTTKDTLQLWLDTNPEATQDNLHAHLLLHLDRVQHCLGWSFTCFYSIFLWRRQLVHCPTVNLMNVLLLLIQVGSNRMGSG